MFLIGKYVMRTIVPGETPFSFNTDAVQTKFLRLGNPKKKGTSVGQCL